MPRLREQAGHITENNALAKYNTESPLSKLKEKNPKLAHKVAASQQAAMEGMNELTGELRSGGKIMYPMNTDGQIHLYSSHDMAAFCRGLDVLIVKGEDVEVTERFRWFLAQDDRRRWRGMTFEPNSKKVKEGYLNLFTGFAIPVGKQKDGGYDIFNDHLLRNVCQNNRVNYEYLLDILAHLFQRPGEKVGVAPVLFGSKGCGKSVVGEVLSECIGRQWCFTVDTPDQLTGKHNSHLAKALLVCADEAINGKDPRHEARVKHMISGGTIMVEPKGVDAFQIESKTNYIFTSNKLNSVATTVGERRYLVLHCGDDNKTDSKFFNAMMAQMRDGGYEALVWDLRKRDISKTDFARPPQTDQLSRQIINDFAGLDRWWVAALTEGRLPFGRDDHGDEAGWPDADDIAKARAAKRANPDGWSVIKALVQASASEFARDYAGRGPTPAAVGIFLAEVVTGLETDRRQVGGVRQHTYTLPSLETCRASFVAARKGVLIEHVGGVLAEAEGDTVDTQDEPETGKVITGRFPGRCGKRFQSVA